MHFHSQLEFWGGLKALPWIIKPVYGILSDAVPLLGYHRRSYLIIFGMLGKRQTICTFRPCTHSSHGPHCPALPLHAMYHLLVRGPAPSTCAATCPI